jgi:hypothetical protein
MIEIKTGIALGISINGQEYPLEKSGFQKLVLASNKRMSTAACELVFSDLVGAINTEITLADGVELVIRLGRDISSYDVYSYRVYNYKRGASSGAPMYIVHGYYDAPKWFLGSWKKPIEGTSSEAISQIASKCGLKSDTDQTNDDMIWLPGNERSCQFVRSIAERGYLNLQSCMSIGMTLDGVYKYKNLTTLPTVGSVFAWGHVENSVNVIDAQYTTNSGYGNSIGGYKHSVRPQSLDWASDKIDNVQVQRKTQYFQQNADVKSMLTSGRIDFGEVDCGNVHRYWDAARYQNMRTAMMYGMGVELMTNQRTPLELDLFSPVTYKPLEPPGNGSIEEAPQWASVYYVTAKAVFLEQGNYFEKFQMASTGINTDPDGKNSQV